MKCEWIPWRVRSQVDSYLRRSALTRAISDWRRLPAPLEPAPRLIERLAYGWGNEEWSPRVVFLEKALECARRSTGPILECGAGLSTILLGILSQYLSRTVWTLEEDRGWCRTVRAALRRYHIDSVRLIEAPLRPYDGYHWYTLPGERLPDRFSLVVCDGPSGKTPGGRYGLVPQLQSRLAEDCVILLDDARRATEQETAARWGEMLQAKPTLVKPGGIWGEYQYAILTVPRSSPTPPRVPAGVAVHSSV